MPDPENITDTNDIFSIIGNDFKLIYLKIENFKNLKNIEINFANNKNFSIIIGNNASGKSNILEAISAIFTEIYTRKRIQNFKFELIYKYQNKTLKIAKPYGYISYFVDNAAVSKNYFMTNDYMPSKVIALYSGDETRMWEEYYEKFYKQYLRELGTGSVHSYSKKLLYIDKTYWNIALLVLLISDLEEHKKYVKEKLHINKVDSIEFYFKPDKIKSCINPILSEFIKQINPEHSKSVVLDLKNLKKKLNKTQKTNQEIFEMLIYANMPRINKIITSIKINFNNNLSLKVLSEGEKKRILIKAVMDLVANERSIILLDEPDAHIHEIGKRDLYRSLKEYTSNEHRHIIMTTHSPTITFEAESSNIIMIDNSNGSAEIISNERKENIRRLTDGLWTILEQNIVINSSNPLILVEGKDDVNYIKHALTIFDDYKDINCDFLPFGGSGNAKYFIEEIKNNLSPNKKVIVLFDRDGDKGSGGVKGLKDCIAPRPSDGGINDNNIYKRDNFYFLLLPKTDEHKEKDTQFLIEDYFSKNCKMRLAINFVKNKKKVLKSLKGLDEKVKQEFCDKFKEHSTDLCFEGFKVLLNKIKNIIEGKEESAVIQLQ